MLADAIAAFEYRAASEDGTRHQGAIAAPSRERALQLLAARGLFVTDIHPARAMRANGRRVAAADLAVTLRVLAELLDSGMPLPRALQALDSLATARIAAVLPAMRASVREGKTLTAALEESGLRLLPVVIGVIRAGERGGGLAEAVRQAAEIAESTAATAASVRAALAYPALLALFGSAALTLLIGVVLPRFATVLADMGSELPPTTRFVLTAADTLRTAALPLLVVLGLAASAFAFWSATPDGRRRLHASLLALPLLGETRHAAASARLAQAFAALLANGVTIGSALVRAAEATGDACISGRALKACARLEQGARLSDAFAEYGVVSRLTGQLVRAGEESGRLTDMLRHAATLERARATRRVQGAVRVIEPTLIVVFGGLVAFVALALLQALYSVRPGT